MVRRAALVLSLSFVCTAARAIPPRTPTCADLLAAFGSRLADATCFHSADLTTNNPATTPANNSLAGLPALAFTPVTDRGVIAPGAGKRTPITRAVPGVQLDARIAADPAEQGRFLLRLPDDWNGSLVVAGASGTRSEFNGDFAWSDYVVQKGFAYASQNKGVLNLYLVGVSATPPSTDPLACRLNPSSTVWVHFYDDDPGLPFTRWSDFMVQGAELARDGVKAGYGRNPRHTYAVGTSNGGYQVRRAIESAPGLFSGGVDWEGTYVDAAPPNLLTDLPAAIRTFAAYAASGFDASSAAYQAMLAAGYPPDIVTNGASLWGNYSASFWEVTQCQWQKRLDPTYDTYGSGTGTYDYVSRLAVSDVGAQMAAFATTGAIKKPLITVAGTMDALLPIQHHARVYAAKVAAALAAEPGDAPAYRLYEVQNGNHIETYQDQFPQLELIEPHAQRAFDLLVDSFEQDAPLPPSQCIARGGAIADAPAQPGQCAALFVP